MPPPSLPPSSLAAERPPPYIMYPSPTAPPAHPQSNHPPPLKQVWAKALNETDLAGASGAMAAKIFAKAADSVLARIAHYVRAADIDFR